MYWADIFLLSFIASSALLGAFQGLRETLLSLAAWTVAFGIALLFMGKFALLLTPFMVFETMRLSIAFISLFVVTLALAQWINGLYLYTLYLRADSWIDRLFAFLMGCGRGIIVALVLVFIAQWTVLPHKTGWQTAYLLPLFQHINEFLWSHLHY